MANEITMPSMGADMTEGTIVKWLKNEGDKVSKGSLIGLIDSEANEQLSSKKLDDKVTEKIISQAEENKISPNGNITKPKTKKPSMYKVLLLNDDFTPMAVTYTHLRANET